jgi:hypothetical protein
MLLASMGGVCPSKSPFAVSRLFHSIQMARPRGYVLAKVVFSLEEIYSRRDSDFRHARRQAGLEELRETGFLLKNQIRGVHNHLLKLC